jgi:ubiquinol-cytochrome c reductase cytochrome b subunit
MTAAALWPFLEQWITGDRREHHVNDRLRNAPTRTALGMAAVSFYGVLWLEGANDVLAQHFDVPLYTITWIARFAVFLVPALAYFITKRTAAACNSRTSTGGSTAWRPASSGNCPAASSSR